MKIVRNILLTMFVLGVLGLTLIIYGLSMIF